VSTFKGDKGSRAVIRVAERMNKSDGIFIRRRVVGDQKRVK
jgi:hypothetical protein